MQRTGTLTSVSFGTKLRGIMVLFKLRLASLVVFSAVLGYLFATPDGAWTWGALVGLSVAGTLLTGASNAFNQVLEVREDGLMKRTADRPLVRGVLSTTEAVVAAFVAAGIATLMLWLQFGPLTSILGFISLFMYVALYTPMKKFSSWAVFIGAFPGAFPPMLGYVAATGRFDLGAGLLFAMQFIWQFPHFWAIAWVLDEDYARAGFRLLPGGRTPDRAAAATTLLYSLFVIPVGMLPWVFGFVGPIAMAVSVIGGLIMVVPAVRLFLSEDKKDARRLMFASFIYLPLVQIAYVLDTL
ncbi:MAG: protoheme IX farnesyltransferase [Flavobacteriales bacterium]|nr:protoheme IX farnesyltransferase [Flavobacteriales bacterium]